MKITHDGKNYVSEKELAELYGVTKEALRQRRKRGKYNNDEILVLPERVYYKVD